MIGIIGTGNMGRAIALRIKKKILVSDIASGRMRFKKARRIMKARDNIDLARRSKVIIIAVKPQHIKGVLAEIRPYIKGKLVISIAAGVSSSYIEKALERHARVIRIMPNMPAMVGMAISALAKGRLASKKDVAVARRIFVGLGEVVEVRESLMDAVTGVSGSGPAYYFLFTDFLEKAARSCGLQKALAKRLAMATFIGAAASAGATSISMQDFIKKVASKGGTTEAALKIFKQKGLERIVKQAVTAACRRSKSLTI